MQIQQRVSGHCPMAVENMVWVLPLFLVCLEVVGCFQSGKSWKISPRVLSAWDSQDSSGLILWAGLKPKMMSLHQSADRWRSNPPQQVDIGWFLRYFEIGKHGHDFIEPNQEKKLGHTRIRVNIDFYVGVTIDIHPRIIQALGICWTKESSLETLDFNYP